MLLPKTGVTFHHKDKATPGLILITPAEGTQTLLVDYAGNVVHEWEVGKGLTSWTYLLPNGNLFANERCAEPKGVELTVSGLMREYDWDGNVVSEHLDPYQHHDARRLKNGGTVYLAFTEMSAEEVAQVKGGVSGSETHFGLFGEMVREVDAAGKVVWEWKLSELGYDRFPIHRNANRWSTAHTNVVQELDDGNYLVSCKILNLVFIVNRQNGELVWHYQNDELGGQHDAQMLDNGNILVFANGAYASDLHHSQVWEIDPTSNEIVWRYRASDNPQSFFSPHIGGVQRLHSGNTLICEGGKGCVFEVTPDGEVVWEYVNPVFNKNRMLGNINWLFRARHYLADGPEIKGRV